MPETRLLPVPISEEERRAFGDTLARLYLEGRALEAEKKRVAGEFKNKIDEKAAAISSISKILASGLEDRYVEVREEIDRLEAVARIYRLDTLALIQVRPLSKSELDPPSREAPAPATSQQAEFFCSNCEAPAATFRGRVFFCKGCFELGESWERSEAAASSPAPAPPEEVAQASAPLATQPSGPPVIIINLDSGVFSSSPSIPPSAGPRLLEASLLPIPSGDLLEEGELAQAAPFLEAPPSPSAARPLWFATPQEGWLTLEECSANEFDRPLVEEYRAAAKRAIKILAKGGELAGEVLLLASPCVGCKTPLEDRALLAHGCYLGASIKEAFRPALSQASSPPSERREILIAEVKATLARGAQGIPTESDRRFTLCTDCGEVIDEIGLAYHPCPVVTDTRREVERVLEAGRASVSVRKRSKKASPMGTLIARAEERAASPASVDAPPAGGEEGDPT